MIKSIATTLLLVFCFQSYAKKVKFAVNMQGQTISPNGIHISGDFQDEAGYPADWDSEATELLKEAGTDIYSITVNIPALRKYEYKFVNGDLFYEVEFVPEKSRVGYDFNDNRWIYVDSLSDDTTFLPVMVFGGNAPLGKMLIRFKVDLKDQTSVSIKGVHLVSNFNQWKPEGSFMYSFEGKIYEFQAYVDSGKYEYLFVNGNTLANKEILSGICVNDSNYRYISVSSDTVLQKVCYASCKDCITAFTSGDILTTKIKIYPSPSHSFVTLEWNHELKLKNHSIFNVDGKMLNLQSHLSDHEIRMDISKLARGIYFMHLNFENQPSVKVKFLVD